MKKIGLIAVMIILAMLIVACDELQNMIEPTEAAPAAVEEAAEPTAEPAAAEEKVVQEPAEESESEIAEPAEALSGDAEEAQPEAEAEEVEPAEEDPTEAEEAAEAESGDASAEETPLEGEPAEEEDDGIEGEEGDVTAVTAANDDSGRVIAGSPWYFESLEDETGDPLEIENPGVEMNMSFFGNGSESSAFVRTECTLDIGLITVAGGAMTYTPQGDLAGDCDPESTSGRLLQDVRSAESYQFDEDKLLISLADDGGTLTFSSPNYVTSWDEALANGLLHCGAPGAVLLVDTPNGRFLEAAGVSDIEALTPMQTGDHFEIGSNSKSFTDVIAVQLQEEGVWSLDDPLSQWLADIAAQLPYGDQITLRQMAQNHSGIWDYADPLITAAIENNTLEQAFTHQEIADYILAEGTPVAEPGTDEAWSYSSSNFILLGMAIEAATGQTLADLYRQRIFEPLEMDESFLLEDVPEPGTIVQGYYTQGMGQPRMNTTNENGSQMWAAGGIVTTAEDLAKYIEGLAAGELFKDPASLEQMLDFGDQPVAGYTGYGLGLGKYNAGNLNAWGHGGQTAGFESLWAYLPDYDTTIIMLTNDAACSNETYFFPQIGTSPDLLTAEMPSGE